MSIDIEKAHWTIRDLQHQVTSNYNNGYESFEHKKDLYQLKFTIDHALKNCPTFAGEQEWLDNIQKQEILNILKSV